MKLSELEISLRERREDCLRGMVNDFVTTLLDQGFTLAEVVDGLTNYTWTNTDSLDACFLLVKASLALAKASEEQRCQN